MKLYIPDTRDRLHLRLETYWGYADDFTHHRVFSSREEAEFVLYESLKIVFADEPEIYKRMNATAEEAFAAARADNIELAREKFLVMIQEVAPPSIRKFGPTG